MAKKTIFKYLTLGFLLLSFIACGEDPGKSNSPDDTEPVIVDTGCAEALPIYSFNFVNNSNEDADISFTVLKYSSEGSPEISIYSYGIVAGQSKYFDGEIFVAAGCPPGSRFTEPPPYGKMMYTVVQVSLTGKTFISVGGSKEDYEANILTDEEYQATVADDSEIIGYKFFYVPGPGLRDGLVSTTDKPETIPYEAFSDIDPLKKSQGDFSRLFTLEINGAESTDLVWSIKR